MSSQRGRRPSASNGSPHDASPSGRACRAGVRCPQRTPRESVGVVASPVASLGPGWKCRRRTHVESPHGWASPDARDSPSPSRRARSAAPRGVPRVVQRAAGGFRPGSTAFSGCPTLWTRRRAALRARGLPVGTRAHPDRSAPRGLDMRTSPALPARPKSRNGSRYDPHRMTRVSPRAAKPCTTGSPYGLASCGLPFNALGLRPRCDDMFALRAHVAQRALPT